jgi:hypothetical protein
MKVAGFKERPDALAAADILREQGYDTEIIGIEGERSISKMSDLPEPALGARWANAFVVSNCDSEHFREIVVNNHGMVVWQHRPGRFSRSERENKVRRGSI